MRSFCGNKQSCEIPKLISHTLNLNTLNKTRHQMRELENNGSPYFPSVDVSDYSVSLSIISSRPYYLCLCNAIVFVGVHCCFVHDQNSHQRSRLGHRNGERYRFCWPGTILTPAQRYLQLRSSQIHDYNDITTHFTSVM